MNILQRNPIHPSYRPDIDGLRACAVLSVVVFHAFPSWMPGGFIGVDIFFVISGFLISGIIFENLNNGTLSFRQFYARRIRRIFPSLTIVLIFCLIFGWMALLSDELNQLGKHTAAAAGFVSNLALWGEAGYFDNSAETKPLLHLWSLGIEEQFYILWPLLIWTAWRYKFNLLAILVAGITISFLLNLLEIGQDPIATFYSPQTRFWELLSGSVLAWIALYRGNASDKEAISTRLTPARAECLSLAGAAVLVSGLLIIDKTVVFPGLWALVPVAGTLMIIAAGPTAWVNRKILSQRAAVWFGLISFPLYLWHWPILSFGQIVYDETPPREFRLAAVVGSVLLAWLTVLMVERPLRQGGHGKFKVAVLICAMASLAVLGLAASRMQFPQSRSLEALTIKRAGYEYAIGTSLGWYRGKQDWLFLGNRYEGEVAKLKLAKIPAAGDVEATRSLFDGVASTARLYGSEFVLIVGPNKSGIYPEYLPNELVPSFRRYSDFFLDRLKTIDNLTVYDPTEDLLASKSTEGLLYWKTDTHWNDKGAFLAFSGLMKRLGLPIPQVEFRCGSTHSGDLLPISGLENFPLDARDNWEVVWKNKPAWTEREIPNEKRTAFGLSSIVINDHALSDKYVWVIGDSFADGLRQYFNGTFREVHYVGHWEDKLEGLSQELARASRKPDVIVMIVVERAF